MGKAEKIHVPIDFAFLLLVEGKHLIWATTIKKHDFLSKQKYVVSSVSTGMFYPLLSHLFPNYVPWASIYNTDPKERDQTS